MDEQPAPHEWELELAALLGELSSVQTELLEVLTEKRRVLAASDTAGLVAVQPREAALIDRLQACQDRRAAMLAAAADDGLRARSLRELARSLSPTSRQRIDPQLQLAVANARLVQHHCLTNWVLTQRTLIHLSQLLEIIATGGRLQPTYGTGEPASAGGTLVDHAA